MLLLLSIHQTSSPPAAAQQVLVQTYNSTDLAPISKQRICYVLFAQAGPFQISLVVVIIFIFNYGLYDVGILIIVAICRHPAVK